MLTFNFKYFLGFIFLLVIEILIAVFFKSGFIRYTIGDFLVVALLYCFIKSFFNLKALTVSITVLLIAFTIEFLQLANILDILNLRGNKTVTIILGSHFSTQDLVAYSLGIISTFFIDIKFNKNIEV